MVTQQQRQRALARAKWERQQAQRAAATARRRRISIVVGVIAGLLAVAALVWLVLFLAGDEEAPAPAPSTPVNTDAPLLNPLPTDQLPPPKQTLPSEGPKNGGSS